jgi:iron complex outermembrane recepter protein
LLMSILSRSSHRFLLVVGLIYLSINVIARADTPATHEFQIGPQALASALVEFSKQADVQVLGATEVIQTLRTPGVVGHFTEEQALERLLRGTELGFRWTGQHTVTIAPRAGSPPASSRDAGAAATSVAPPQTSNAGTPNLTEIIVTAQKREERLIDVPQSVSVLSSQTLANLGALQFADFANTVPGLGFTTVGPGYTQISMRGVTTGEETNPSVGIYIDDVPYGSSTAFAFGGQYAFDLNLLDVDRIEILRGPQGTLYGASTMGGVIKYVSKLPDTNSFSADVRTGVSDTHDGGVSYDVATAVNLPLAPGVAALRASAFYSRDGGYIDNVALGEERANRSEVHGGRLDFLLTPGDALSIRVGAVLQDISRAGQAAADYTMSGTPVYGSLGQYRLYGEPFDQQFQLFSSTIRYDFGAAALTSITSYQAVHTQVFYDFSAEFLPYFNGPPPDGLGLAYGAVGFPDEDSTSKFTQEVRLASSGHQELEWIVGAFYTHEASVDREAFVTENLAHQPVANDLLDYTSPTTYQEYAVFGDVTYRFTKSVDVTGGIRYARNNQIANETATGLFGASYPAPISSTQGVFTYLGNARYHFDDHSTGYVRYATGYRPGGPNPLVFNSATGIPEVPQTFQPDQLKSYEIGYNAESADRRFGIDFDAYYIDWRDLQVITSTSNGFGAYTNASAATVHGVELQLTAHPTDDFAATGAFAYQDPHLTQSSPIVGGAAGERLPNSAHFTASLNGDYTFTAVPLHPSVGATFRYVGNRTASFNQDVNNPQYLLPAYRSFDLRSGLDMGSTHLQLYVHNLLDERGQLSAFTGRGPLAQVSILQPRTIGISATSHF